MAINTYLSKTESKKQNKPTSGTKTESQIENILTVPDGMELGGQTKEEKGLKSTNWQLQNCHGDVKYSIGNREAIELICMTHGHEQRSGDCLREWAVGAERGEGGKTGTTVIAQSINYNL